jgi:hypothetical protein
VARKVQFSYSDEERFDAEFKKRQVEITNEISIWSQSESFSGKVRDVVNVCQSDHDGLVNLSNRLFQNGVFLASFRELTKKEAESNKNKTWVDRFNYWWGAVIGALVVVVVEFLWKKCL